MSVKNIAFREKQDLIDNHNYKHSAQFSDSYLGNYRLIRMLGHGGFAAVFLGEHRYLKRLAAIKVLRTVLAEQEMVHFLEEARLLANLSHPHIVRVLEFAVTPRRIMLHNSEMVENIPFLVMDYVSGGNLRTVHLPGTPVPLDTVISHVKQVAEALYYAHTQRIIHRDIKPENLLLNERKEVMLSDFGLAISASWSSLLSRQDTAGTLPYTAPEQLQGKPGLASDQYSLGIVAYEWLCGSLPFNGGDAEIIMQHISSPPPRLRSKNPSVSPAVEAVVLKALAKDPVQRYETILAFAHSLEQASYGLGPSALLEAFPVEDSPLAPSNVFPFFYYFSQQPMAPSPDTAGKRAALYPLAEDLKIKRQYPVLMTPSKQRNRQRMLQKVRTFWITGVLEPSLHGAPLITPELHERHDAVAHPWTPSPYQKQKDSPVLAAGTSISEIYDQAGGELLILGEAGTGKTTMLLHLARHLLDRAEQDESAPIPVVFQLSSWEEKQLPLEQWLIEELNSKYLVPRLLGGMWLRSEMLLPLLDGLDEVTEKARSACIIAINTYKQQYGLSPLVVCSRLTDYLLFPPRVLLQRAIVVQALTMQQVDDYFRNAGEKFQVIYQILRRDTLLYGLITTPLMLNIITLAYQDKSPIELLTMRSSTERYQRIFHTYVEQMLQRHSALTSSLSHTPQQLISGLTSLARKMQQRGQAVFYIEQIQPEWINKEKWREVYLWIAVLLPGALAGALMGLLGNDLFFHAGDFKAVLLDSLYGLLMGYLFSGRRPERVSSKRQPITQRTARKKLSTGNPGITPIFLGLISILFLGFAKGWPDGLINGTYLGLMCIPMSILLQGKIEAKSRRKPAKSKNARFLAKYPLFEHISNGLIIGPVCGVSNILTNVIRQGISHYSISFYLTLGIRETLHNFLLGTLISLLLLHKNNGTIYRSEVVVWSWKRFLRRLLVPKYALNGLLVGLAVGLTYGLKETLEGSLNNGLSDGLTDTALLTVGFCLVSAILYGISSRDLTNQHRYKPNEGISRSLRHGIIGGIIGIFAAIVSYIFSDTLASTINSALIASQTRHFTFTLLVADGVGTSLKQALKADLHNAFLLGLAGGLLTFLLLGGLAALQHGILRLILWRTKVFPLNIARFLDYATDSVLLHKVGGGYMFIHRFLLEYFVSLQQRQGQHNELEPSQSEPLARLL